MAKKKATTPIAATEKVPSATIPKAKSVTLVTSYTRTTKSSHESVNRSRKWVRRRMSYVAEDEDSDGSNEEEELKSESVREKRKIVSDQSEQSSRDQKKKGAKKKPRGKAEKGSKGKKRKDKISDEETVVKITRPPEMYDDIILMIKDKKEAKKLEEEAARAAELASLLTSGSKPEDLQEKAPPKLKTKRGKTKRISSGILRAEREKAEAQAAELLKKQEEADSEVFVMTEKRKETEQAQRLDGLEKSLECIRLIDEHSRRVQLKEMKETYWRLYVECGDLPIVNHISDMSMYLQTWKDSMVDTTPEEASSRTRDALKLLNVLDDFIENKPPKSLQRLENFKWLRETFRTELKDMMEAMTFKLLRDVERNMNHLTLSTGDFNYKDDRFILSLCLKFQLPTPLFNPRKAVPPPISLTFEGLKMSVDFPPSIDGERMVIRVMYLIYDHLSDSSRSFLKPAKPEYYNYNLVEVMEKEWKVKQKYKIIGKYRAQYEQELQKHEMNMLEKANYKPFSMGPPPPDLPPLPKFELPVVDSDTDIPDVAPIKLDPTAEEYAEGLEEVAYEAMKSNLLYSPEEFEINLRKYIILGGLHVMNLFMQPPQPQNLVTMELNVVTFVLPKQLVEVPFFEEYSTQPPSDEQKTPEQLESAIKLQEEGFSKLISVTITLPKHVMYLELPIVCMWEEEDKIWSTKDVHDVKQNEEKGTVSFRTGRFGIIGLATFRYGNLPYQTWEIKPDEDDNIVFQITAAVLMFEFKIKGSSVTVTQFQNVPNNALQDIVSKSFPINKLAKILREGGVDIFPDHDAFCYVEGSCEKHWATEYICYYTMAHMSICYNFSWSRWNATEGYRSMVMQMRIFNPELQTQKPYSLVLVTPLRAAFINCTEVTPVFCNEPVEGSKFCCNLWYLMKATSTIYVRNKLPDISQETIHTVAKMLIGTRILSFS